MRASATPAPRRLEIVIVATVVLDVVGYIINTHPKVFVIEEAQGFNAGSTKAAFDKVVRMLKEVSSRGKPLYHVEWRILNTADTTAIPRNRARIYLVGMWKSLAADPQNIAFEWPEAKTRSTKLSHFLRRIQSSSGCRVQIVAWRT